MLPASSLTGNFVGRTAFMVPLLSKRNENLTSPQRRTTRRDQNREQRLASIAPSSSDGARNARDRRRTQPSDRDGGPWLGALNLRSVAGRQSDSENGATR